MGGHAALHRHNSTMAKRPSDSFPNSAHGTVAGGGSGSNLRINSSENSPRGTPLAGASINGGAGGVGGVGAVSSTQRGSQLGLGAITNMHRKNSMMNAAMNAQHMAKLAAGECDDGMSSPRSDDIQEEDVNTSLRPKPAALQQLHSRALSFMSSFDRTRRSVDAGGGGAPTGRTPTSQKEPSAPHDKEKDKDTNSNASQKSNGSDKPSGTGRDGVTTLRNLFSSLLQHQQGPPQGSNLSLQYLLSVCFRQLSSFSFVNHHFPSLIIITY